MEKNKKVYKCDFHTLSMKKEGGFVICFCNNQIDLKPCNSYLLCSNSQRVTQYRQTFLCSPKTIYGEW